LAAVTGRVKQIVLAGHRFGSHKATSPATGLDTTLRQPAGTFARSRPLQAFCPVASARSSAFGPPGTLQALSTERG